MNVGAARLRALFASGALVSPRAEMLSTVDLANALAAIAGAPRFEGEVGARTVGGLIGEPQHLVFVLADGLGMNLIERLPEQAFLRKHLKRQMTAVFPSSTGPALTSLATGLWPAAHAVPAWFTYLPQCDRTAVVLPYRDRASQKDLGRMGVEARRVFPANAVARFFRRDYAAFQPAPIAASVYTRYVIAGPRADGYQTLDGAIDAIASRIEGAPNPTYTYLYWPEVDASEHDFGPASTETKREVLKLDSGLERLKEMVGDNATIVVSADHGLIGVPEHLKFVLSDGDELQDMLRVWPPSGEPRCLFFHVRPGHKAAFAEAFHRRFDGAFILLSTDEADALRLFGPAILSPESRARIGDFIAVPEGAQAIGYGGEAGILTMRGFHGGLTPDEMRIPLVVA